MRISEPERTLACLIIDDPLLKPRYGCLVYEKLLKAMEELDFFCEIAFIPWNYLRTNPKTIRLLIDNPNRFGICVHGCNHTKNEFGGTDYDKLKSLSIAAMQRMEQFAKITKLRYDRIMVFPQGYFSSIAMQVLKEVGFKACFNSTLKATDRNDLPSAEYKLPATYAYHRLPLFLRRYPENRSGLLKDLSCGRPLIIVEHSAAFGSDFKKISDLVSWINGQSNVSWRSLSEIVDHYCGLEEAKISLPEGHTMLQDNSFKTAMRRYACEFRDQFVERYRPLSLPYRALRNIVSDLSGKKSGSTPEVGRE